MKRWKFPFVVFGLAVGVLVAATGATGYPIAKPKPKPKPVFVTEIRADTIDSVSGQIVAGGIDAAEAPSGNLFLASASVQLRTRTVGKPAGTSFSTSDVTGGGEYAIRQGTTTVDEGAWSVTGAAQVSLLGGTFSGAVDAIGHADQAIGGRIQVTAHLVPDSGAPRDATLTLDCNLSGSSELVEGFKITDGSVTYSQFEGGGSTLFHRWIQRVK